MLAKQRNSCIQLWSERLLAPAPAVAEMSWAQAPASQEPWVEQDALWIYMDLGRIDKEAVIVLQSQKKDRTHTQTNKATDWWAETETEANRQAETETETFKERNVKAWIDGMPWKYEQEDRPIDRYMDKT